MFKYRRPETVHAKVDVSLPSGEAGSSMDGSFIAEYRYVSRAQLDELQRQYHRDAQLLDQVLVGISGIGDGSAEYPAEHQRELVLADVAMTAAALIRFNDVLLGGASKNWRPSLSP